MHLKCHILVLKIFPAVPQSTPTKEASIIIEEPAESASSMATSPGFLTVSSQDASTQCCVGATIWSKIIAAQEIFFFKICISSNKVRKKGLCSINIPLPPSNVALLL